jgi:leishmanolysin-like peptidase
MAGLWAASLSVPPRQVPGVALHSGGAPGPTDQTVLPPALSYKPHLVINLADDLGYYDVGWKNKELKTPFLDNLMASGTELTRHYAYSTCVPSRGALMTGRHPIHVNTKSADPLTSMWGADLRMTTMPELLKTAGYKTAMIGKWHLGTRWSHSLPGRRGFDYHFGILGGSGDHATQETTAVSVPKQMWSPTTTLTSLLHDNHRGLPWDLWEKKEPDETGRAQEGPAVGQTGKQHSCFLYTNRAVGLLARHDASIPLFLYFSQQVPHMPLTTLPEFEDPSNIFKMSRTYNAMVACADQATQNITIVLKARGMWDKTLMLVASDNGGHTMRAGNNYPFRGGKYTDFEGGVRTVAFLAGGVLPASAPKKVDGIVAIADWYATFAYLAGLSDHTDTKAASFKTVPPVDGLNVWPMITGQAEEVKDRWVPFDDALIVGDYKLIKHDVAVNYDFSAEVGDMADDNGECAGFWPGPEWPVKKGTSKTSLKGYKDDVKCPEEGCLYHLKDDPSEEHDLSTSSSHATKYKEMIQAFDDAHSDAHMWQFNGQIEMEKYTPPEDTECLGLTAAVEHHQGFLGPVCLSKSEISMDLSSLRQIQISTLEKRRQRLNATTTSRKAKTAQKQQQQQAETQQQQEAEAVDEDEKAGRQLLADYYRAARRSGRALAGALDGASALVHGKAEPWKPPEWFGRQTWRAKAPCEDFCQSHKEGWAGKCGWGQLCAGCGMCLRPAMMKARLHEEELAAEKKEKADLAWWNAHKEEELAKAQQKEKADAKWWAAHKNDKKWSKGAGEEA